MKQSGKELTEGLVDHLRILPFTLKWEAIREFCTYGCHELTLFFTDLSAMSIKEWKGIAGLG